MRERPIRLKAHEVRAILSGAKTQTRRAVKPRYSWQLEERDDGSLWPWYPDYVTGGEWDGWVPCPFGQPGDRLWVRETTHVDRTTSDSAELARYSADQEPVCYPTGTGNGYDGAWQLWWYTRDTCPNIHMPRSACRLLLEITDVRVERLHAISEADALAEGVAPSSVEGFANARVERPAGFAFRDIWTSTGGDWDANPWVWVIGFKQVTP
ncbi:hypothetical protein [Xanthomonas sp. 4461]|uniref:hypothetical protein n=1 Tax=Xanthomonas sp. 4461 TaxID=3035313 RepID=UPI0021672145|nr:hypothetical protein [Xanthomonas sp. 4461]MCS3807851.1 hypothetical protein [Xanthomonas sp. 4461]